MVSYRQKFVVIGAFCLIALASIASAAQAVKRVVVVKVDGLPAYYVDEVVKQRDAEGRSTLPWIEEVFYKKGTRVPNFYTRGMSLSGPSWGQVDSGQHMQLKGNVEYDRYTMHAYDYLNFLPYYINYGLKKRADMPATEVMDQLGIPIVADAFNYQNRYTSQQLFQRGTNWEVLASGFVNLYPGNARDFIDEWTIGLNFRRITIDQSERDIIGKLEKRPEIDYFDYYDVSFDHISHHNNDTQSRVAALKDLDRTIGRIWLAIQKSSRADETAMIMISDHGVNSDPRVYSQGFNLVRLLGSYAGGGHHIITKRRLMLDYSILGIYPLTPVIRTEASESFYLRGQQNKYPTALLDFDGNERSSLHLRNSDLNVLHILLQQLKHAKLSENVRRAAIKSFFEIIDRNRSEWREAADQLSKELDALERRRESRSGAIDALPKKFTPDDIALGLDKAAVRERALHEIDEQTVEQYEKYLMTLREMLSLKADSFDPRKLEIEKVVAPGAMGEQNSLHQLQNYVVGISNAGLTVDQSGNIDPRSFARVNYFELLLAQKVRNNVQKGVGNRPIDFVAVRVPLGTFGDVFGSIRPNEDPVLLYGGSDKQALILSRLEASGERSYKLLPVTSLVQGADGKTTFQPRAWAPGLPLKYIEDDLFNVPVSTREAWLGEWHTELDWLEAAHRTKYSNGIIGLNEQMDRHSLPGEGANLSADERLVRRFRERQRSLTEADLLILANDHWNFDVRGFNPGGNHGSFFRVSTNSTFMIAGGAATGIPHGMAVERPYDSLSFVPTLFRLMGKIDENNEPNAELKKRGFTRFPGRVIRELTGGK